MEIFEKRLNKLEPELRSLYFSFYDSQEAYAQLLEMLKEAYRTRKQALKDKDLAREQDPKWFLHERMFGMTMYPRHFAGDLNGIRENLDYLSGLGVTYLHLMPLLKMPYPDNDGGYAIEDFRQVDPKIGTNADLEALADALRERGISLCLDFVMNHTADSHEWAIRAKAGEKEYQDCYYCYDTREIPDKFEENFHEILPADAPGNFVYSEEMGKWVMSRFYRFYEGSIPGSWSRGSLFNYDPVTRDARSNGRAASLCGIETALEAGDPDQVLAGISRLLLMNAAGMSLRGYFMIYSGDEVAQLNDYSFESDPQLAKENRNIHRQPFDWTWAEGRKTPGTVQQQVYDGLRRMAQIRRQHPCFGANAYVSTWDTPIHPGRKGYAPEKPWEQPVLAIYRAYEGEQMFCLSNFAGRELEIQLPTVDGVYRDLFTGETVSPACVDLAPWQYRWIVKM